MTMGTHPDANIRAQLLSQLCHSMRAVEPEEHACEGKRQSEGWVQA